MPPVNFKAPRKELMCTVFSNSLFGICLLKHQIFLFIKHASYRNVLYDQQVLNTKRKISRCAILWGGAFCYYVAHIKSVVVYAQSTEAQSHERPFT